MSAHFQLFTNKKTQEQLPTRRKAVNLPLL